MVVARLDDPDPVGRLIWLDLSGNALTGSTAAEIGNLGELHSLSL